MPNVSLAPVEKEMSVEDMVAETDDAILITGDGSWSIDHQRYNFQFGGQTFHEVKGGKVVGTLRDLAYQSTTVEFWNACDRIGGARAWKMNGALFHRQGEPIQDKP